MLAVALLAGRAHAAPPDVRPYQRALCSNEPCCVLEVTPAGKSKKGEILEIVTVGPGPSKKKRCPAPVVSAAPAGDANVELVAPPEEDFDAFRFAQPPREDRGYHLVVKSRGKIVRNRSLVELGQDPEWGGKVLAESISFDPRRQLLRHSQYGGGNDSRWSRTVGVALDPPRAVSHGSSQEAPGADIEREWSWDRFAGTLTAKVADCNDDGSLPEPGGQESESRALLIPRVSLPESFRSGGWRTTALGGCAARADGAGAGFVVHGPPGAARDARLSVVASLENELYVEIEDDVLVGPGAAIAGKSWVTDDHLEIWAATTSGLDSWCRNDKGAVAQWAVRLTDGKGFAGYGKPDWSGVNVELERRDRLVRIKLTGIASDHLTVVYSDSDDGKKQERLVATSSLSYGKTSTLGEVFIVPEERARCVLDDKGSLRPKVKPPADAGPVSQPLNL